MSETKLRQLDVEDVYEAPQLNEHETDHLAMDPELEAAVEEIFSSLKVKYSTPKNNKLKIREDAIVPGSRKKESAENVVDENESETEIENEPTSRFGRVKNAIGKYSAMASLVRQEAMEKLAARAQKSKQELEDDKLTPQERRRKKIGTRIAAGTLAGLSVVSFLALYKAGYHGSGGSTNLALSEPFLPDGSTNIAIGGTDDGNGEIITHMIDTWTGSPTEAHVVEYPAGIAPKDPITYDASAEIGADNLRSTIENVDGEKTVYSYSQGTVAAGEELSRIAEENGGELPDDLRAVFVSSPQTPGTGFHETAGDYFSAPMEAFGIDVETGEIPLGENTTIIGARGDGISNMPDPAKNPLGAADSVVGYLSGRHWYGDLDPSQLQTRVAEDGTTYVTVLPKSGIDSPTLDLAQRNGYYVSPQAEAFAEAIAPQVDTGGVQPELNPSEIVSTGVDLLEDTAKFHGVDIDLPDIAVNPMPAPMPEPEIFNAPTPAPEFTAPVDNWTPPVEQIAPAVETIVPQVNEIVEQVAPQINEAVEQVFGGTNAPAPAPNVQQAAGQIQGAINQFFGR